MKPYIKGKYWMKVVIIQCYCINTIGTGNRGAAGVGVTPLFLLSLLDHCSTPSLIYIAPHLPSYTSVNKYTTM